MDRKLPMIRVVLPYKPSRLTSLPHYMLISDDDRIHTKGDPDLQGELIGAFEGVPSVWHREVIA